MSLDPTSANGLIREICTLAPIIPVLVIEDVGTARPLAEALVAGGLPALEVTLRTPDALEAIRIMSEVSGGMLEPVLLLPQTKSVPPKRPVLPLAFHLVSPTNCSLPAKKKLCRSYLAPQR